MKIKLFTRDGGFVADETIPPFNEQPDVIFWGQRVFVVPSVDGPELDYDDATETAYVEAFTYAVPFAGVGH